MRNYISKINDRNLQRKRESGITTYALYSILIIILYKITELYPLIPFKNKFWEVLEILAYAFSIVFFVELLIAIYDTTEGSSSSTRLVWKSKKKDNFLETIITISNFLIPLVSIITISVYMLFNNEYSIYYIINSLIITVILFLTVKFSRANKLENYYDIFEGTGSSSDAPGFDIISSCICLIDIMFGFYYIYSSESINGKINILIFGVLVMLVPTILEKINTLREVDTFSNDLENLEYEINVRNLTDDEIRERLQKNYMGFLLSEWINYGMRELDNFHESMKEKVSRLEEMKESLVKIDKSQYPIEYQGRVKNISETTITIQRNIVDFYAKKISEIDVIIRKSTLDHSERQNLLKFRLKLVKEQKRYTEQK